MKKTNRALIGTSAPNRPKSEFSAAALTAKTCAISLFARSFDYLFPRSFERVVEKARLANRKGGWVVGGLTRRLFSSFFVSRPARNA
jgi:hypothetical protein